MLQAASQKQTKKAINQKLLVQYITEVKSDMTCKENQKMNV